MQLGIGKKKGPPKRANVLRTSEAWARKQRRDRRGLHVVLHAGERPSQAAL